MGRETVAPVVFRGIEIEADLNQRGDALGLVAKRDLERYYTLLRDEFATLRLTEAEASLLCDVCNGTIWEPHTMRLLWAQIADAEPELFEKWGVDQAPFISRLRQLTPGQTFAIVDAIERFWRAPNEPDRLRAVGLVR